MSKIKKVPVSIKWVDSHAPGELGWIETKRIPTKITHCWSVGYIVRETKKTITLAAHLAGKDVDQVDGCMTIPKCAIVSRKVLKGGR